MPEQCASSAAAAAVRFRTGGNLDYCAPIRWWNAVENQVTALSFRA